MRVLFLNPENYVPFEREASNYEFRMPALRAGGITEHRDFQYQRLFHAHGRAVMERELLREVELYRPDCVFYSGGFGHQCPSAATMNQIRAAGFPVLAVLWDTFLKPRELELDLFASSDYLLLADSFTNYARYRLWAETANLPVGVGFLPGHQVLPEIFARTDAPKDLDVTFLGSVYGSRVGLLDYLSERLSAAGIRLHVLGGNLKLVEPEWEDGVLMEVSVPSDRWISWETYIDTINRSKVCLCPTAVNDRPQIKGKLFEFLSCGACTLVERNYEIASVVPDSAVVYFRGAAECADKIIELMADEARRSAQAEAGYRWFHDRFDYKRFWEDIFNTIKTGRRSLTADPPIEERYRKFRADFLRSTNGRDPIPYLREAEFAFE